MSPNPSSITFKNMVRCICIQYDFHMLFSEIMIIYLVVPDRLPLVDVPLLSTMVVSSVIDQSEASFVSSLLLGR